VNNCLKKKNQIYSVSYYMTIFSLNVDFPPCFMLSKIFYQVDFCVRIVGCTLL